MGIFYLNGAKFPLISLNKWILKNFHVPICVDQKIMNFLLGHAQHYTKKDWPV